MNHSENLIINRFTKRSRTWQTYITMAILTFYNLQDRDITFQCMAYKGTPEIHFGNGTGQHAANLQQLNESD